MSDGEFNSYTYDELKSVLAEADPRLVDRFWRYHVANPSLFSEFRRRAEQMRAVGRKKYSGWVIIQRIRWERDLQTPGEVFKINNDYIALYARMLVHEDPTFVGFFELRAMKPFGRRISGEQYRRESEEDES